MTVYDILNKVFDLDSGTLDITAKPATDADVATETTLSSIDGKDFATETSLLDILKTADLSFTTGDLDINLNADAVGLFKTSDFTETRTIDADNVGLAKTTDFQDVTINAFGTKNVTTSGTAEQLDTATVNSYVKIKALSGNTGDVYIGDSTVTTTNGYPLSAGEEIKLNVTDLSNISLDVDTDGEGVKYIGI